jgi:aspartyl-tRNA synthetase
MAQWQRTHTCGELRESDINRTVVLNGWVNSYRGYNDQVFIDLRDRYGLTQVVFEVEGDPELFRRAHQVRAEWVLSVRGKVRHRLPGKTNPKLPTGAVEVVVEQLRVLNEAKTPPFEVMSIPQEDQSLGDPELAGEELRLEYRYVDLRRPSLQRTLALRHRMNSVMREYLDKQGFIELETPLLGRSTPEGARDYLVPSRIWPGSWYALPQSPQLYKQLAMVAGFDKYYQIARCLRDEDLRADRQPEFTQLDLEMSFVEQDDVFGVIEGLTAEVFRRCLGVEVALPLPRLRYEDAMARYGTDKPDQRYGLEIVDVTELAGQTEFGVFREVAAAGGKVRGLNVKGAAGRFSNTDLKPGGRLAGFVEKAGAKGLAWLKAEAEGFAAAGIAKFIPQPVQQALRQRLAAEPGDLLLFVADTKEEVVCDVLGALRVHLAGQLGLVDPARHDFKIAWVVDFPSFLWDADEKRWVANHHPFTAPQDEHLDCLARVSEEDLTRPDSPLAGIRAKAYDLVINGYECAGGSIRIHDPKVQGQVFRALGMTPEQARQRFGFLLDALQYGAPPHGGIALGLDRWAMMLAGTTNIRDVIAYPKNQRARDLMTGAPAPVDPRQLKELGL